jgi:hypothetical protein
VAVLRKTISQANAQAAAARQAPQQQQANAQADNIASSDLATQQGAHSFAADLGKLASDVSQANTDLAGEEPDVATA